MIVCLLYGVNDTGEFYVIDLSALEGLTLNYGEDYEKTKDGSFNKDTNTNIYIINTDSLNIFFVRGISINGTIYYTDEKTLDKTEVEIVT